VWYLKNKKKYLWIITIILLSVIIGPLLISWGFRTKAPFDWLIAEFDASALLSYYGALIASVIAILGVYLTIQYSQKNYKEDVKNRVLPFITIYYLRDDTIQKDVNNDIKSEYKSQDYYFVLTKEKIRCKSTLLGVQQDLIDSNGMTYNKNAVSEQWGIKNYIYIPLEIENIGNGVATKLSFGLNKQSVKESEWDRAPAISLKTFSPFRIYIFSESPMDVLGKYILSFCYEDIYCNMYKQDFIIEIEHDSEKGILTTVVLNVEQKFLGTLNNQ